MVMVRVRVTVRAMRVRVRARVWCGKWIGRWSSRNRQCPPIWIPPLGEGEGLRVKVGVRVWG